MAKFRLFPKRPNHTQGCWSSSNAFLMLEALSVVKQTIFSFGIFQAWRILNTENVVVGVVFQEIHCFQAVGHQLPIRGDVVDG